ncbi:hypothetical protein OCT63_17080 [Vibrio sp. RW]|uniref:hypothetical protein n=1 Tax=Vibrio sp. RW TaxID=2998833 RepID=UPI0022CD5A56|nr:hypothetical protein [Vibrio sp. RW]MDA0145941.1 hypothetical protein [Vibrio sp. RW]
MLNKQNTEVSKIKYGLWSMRIVFIVPVLVCFSAWAVLQIWSGLVAHEVELLIGQDQVLLQKFSEYGFPYSLADLDRLIVLGHNVSMIEAEASMTDAQLAKLAHNLATEQNALMSLLSESVDHYNLMIRSGIWIILISALCIMFRGLSKKYSFRRLGEIAESPVAVFTILFVIERLITLHNLSLVV